MTQYLVPIFYNVVHSSNTSSIELDNKFIHTHVFEDQPQLVLLCFPHTITFILPLTGHSTHLQPNKKIRLYSPNPERSHSSLRRAFLQVENKNHPQKDVPSHPATTTVIKPHNTSGTTTIPFWRRDSPNHGHQPYSQPSSIRS